MRPTLVALTTGAALLAATACGTPTDDTDGTTTVTAGVIPIVDVAPVHLGVEQGFFSDRGIDLRLESVSGGAANVPGVISGESVRTLADLMATDGLVDDAPDLDPLIR